MLASMAYISKHTHTHTRWPEPEPAAGCAGAPRVRVHPHHLLILLSSRGRHHGLSHRQFGGLAQARRQVLARYNGRSSADDWQTQLGPKLSNSRLVAFLAHANQKTFTSLPPFFLLGNAGGQAPRKPSTRHLPDTAPPCQVLSSVTSSRRRGAASLPFFLSFVSHVHEGRRPPEGRTIAWSAPSIMHQKPLVVGVWLMCHPYRQNRLHGKEPRLRIVETVTHCSKTGATYQREHVRQRQRKRPRDAQTRTRIVRSQAEMPRRPLDERCPRGCPLPQIRQNRTSAWRSRWLLQATTNEGLAAGTLHNANRRPTEPGRLEHGRRTRHDRPSHTTVRLSIDSAHLVRPASPTTLPCEAHHQTTCTTNQSLNNSEACLSIPRHFKAAKAQQNTVF